MPSPDPRLLNDNPGKQCTCVAENPSGTLGLEAPMIAASGRVRSIVRIPLHELPGFGQDQVTPNPFEQLIADRFLQLPQLTADGRLSYEESLQAREILPSRATVQKYKRWW